MQAHGTEERGVILINKTIGHTHRPKYIYMNSASFFFTMFVIVAIEWFIFLIVEIHDFLIVEFFYFY